MTLVDSRKQTSFPSSYDTSFYQIPSILLTQSSCLRLVHVSDIASCYSQNPLENIEGLKQELHRLRASVWRFFYLDYENLIKSSNILLYNQYESNQLVSFYNSFAFELNKVNEFFAVKSGEISRRLEYVSKPSSTPMITSFITLNDAVDELTFDIQDLWHFIKINFRTFLGIIYYLDTTLGDGHDLHKKTITQDQQSQIEKNLLLQRLYRLLVPVQFLDLDLFLHWCLELGSIYRDQFGKNPPNHALITRDITDHYSSSCFDASNNNNNNIGSSVLSPPSPPPTLYAPIMTRDSSNASTGSLPSSSAAPPSPTLTIPSCPSINGQSNPPMHYSNDESFQTPFSGLSAASSPQSDHSTPWMDDALSTPDVVKDSTISTNDTIYTFWIHPDNLLEVTMYLAKYMDVIKSHQQASHSLARYEIESPEHRSCLQDPSPPQSSANHRPIQHWQPVTTLYMDAPDLKNYINRIGSTSDINDNQQTTVPCLRLRRYNSVFSRINDTKHLTTQFCSSTSFYALEKKIYVDKTWRSTTPPSSLSASSISLSSTYTGDTSSKKIGKKPYRLHHRRPEPTPSWSSIHSRIWLKSKRCKAWMNHQWSLRNVLIKSSSSHHYTSFGKHDINRKYIEQQILEMESDLQTHKLEPVLKTSFNRIGFKWTGDNDSMDDHDQQGKRDMVTITIDTDITMTKYDTHQVTKDPLQQDDYPCATMPSNELVRFPFVLLRVKLPYNFASTGVAKSSSVSSSSSSSPSFMTSCSWLGQLFSCPMLEPIQNFSLYLHGISILFADKIDVLPYWHDKMDLDLQRTEHQGYLSGLRRAYHHQHQRQHSNKSSSQDSASDSATPWSFTNTTLTVSSTKGSNSPNHIETRATTPEPMDTATAATCTEGTTTTTPVALLPLHPLEQADHPTTNYFTCATTTTTPAFPSTKKNLENTSRKPSILLSPAPATTTSPSAQSSPSSSFALSPSSTPIPDERTPLLPSPNESTKGSSIHCHCDITSYGHNCHDHDPNSTSQKQRSSSNHYSHQLYKIAEWIQPRFAALPWFRNSKEKGLHLQQQQQLLSDDYHTSIDMSCDHSDTTTTVVPTVTHNLYDTWDDAMMMARRPVPLTLLCGLGSFIIAYILYLVISL